MVAVAQLVRASDCGSEGRGFETPQSPNAKDPEVSLRDFLSPSQITIYAKFEKKASARVYMRARIHDASVCIRRGGRA